jgi:hypothetical protein
MRKGSGFAIDAWHKNEIADVRSSCLRGNVEIAGRAAPSKKRCLVWAS